MSTQPRKLHTLVGGDLAAARTFGLTVIAKCGLVFVPKRNDSTHGLELCDTCDSLTPHRLTIDPHFVYRCFDAEQRLLYVGCSVSPSQRIEQHRAKSWWWPQVARTRLLWFPNREYALHKEREAIAVEQPRWNIRDRDRTTWGPEDYSDLLHNMRRNRASDKSLARVRREAEDRFDISFVEFDRAS